VCDHAQKVAMGEQGFVSCSARDQDSVRKPGSMLTWQHSLLDLDFSEYNHGQRAPTAVHRIFEPVRVDFCVNETPKRRCGCP